MPRASSRMLGRARASSSAARASSSSASARLPRPPARRSSVAQPQRERRRAAAARRRGGRARGARRSASAGGDDPLARRLHLLELGADLGGEPLVVEREPRGGGDRAPAAPAPRAARRRGRARRARRRRARAGSRPAVAGPGDAALAAVRVEVGVALGRPAQQPQAGVGERPPHGGRAGLRGPRRRGRISDVGHRACARAARARATGDRDGDRDPHRGHAPRASASPGLDRSRRARASPTRL